MRVNEPEKIDETSNRMRMILIVHHENAQDEAGYDYNGVEDFEGPEIDTRDEEDLKNDLDDENTQYDHTDVFQDSF